MAKKISGYVVLTTALHRPSCAPFTFFWFDPFLEARAEILKKISLVFFLRGTPVYIYSFKRWHQKDISKLTDL